MRIGASWQKMSRVMMKMMMIIAKKGLSSAERALEVVTNTSTGCNGLSKASCPINLSLARVCVSFAGLL